MSRATMLNVAKWMLVIVFLELVPVLNALPIKPTPAPEQLSQDCTTLIVSNDRRLTATRNGRRSSSADGCGNRRKPKKLPAIVGDLFREEVDNYPEEEIKSILKETPNDLKDLYNVLNTQLDPNTNLTERVALYPNDDEEREREESVCRTVTRNIYPREANLRNSLVYIPNNHDFMQVIQAEICQHPDQECSFLRDNLPYGMVSACVQKYSYKKLLYMDPLDKRLSSDLFRYPSCCVCNVRTLPFDLRSNASNHSRVSNRPHHSAPQLPPPTTAMPLYESSSDADVTPNATQNVDAGNSLGSPQQPSDRSHHSEPTSDVRSPRRSSKQLRRPTNQTLILSEDRVYMPSR